MTSDPPPGKAARFAALLAAWMTPDPQTHLGRLSADQIAVLVALHQHADADGRAFPSQARLGAMTGVSRPTACKAIAALVNKGLVAQEHRVDPRTGGPISALYAVIYSARPPVVDTPPCSLENRGVFSREQPPAVPTGTGARNGPKKLTPKQEVTDHPCSPENRGCSPGNTNLIPDSFPDPEGQERGRLAALAQQLPATPWTRVKAQAAVDAAILRSGADAVQGALMTLRAQRAAGEGAPTPWEVVGVLEGLPALTATQLPQARATAIEDEPADPSPTGRAWADVRAQMRAQIGEAAFSSWLKELNAASGPDGVVLVAKSRFSRDWIATHYLPHIRRLFEGRGVATVEIDIAPPAPAKSPEPPASGVVVEGVNWQRSRLGGGARPLAASLHTPA